MARSVTISERELRALREAAGALKDLTESMLRASEAAKRSTKSSDIFRKSLITKSRKKFQS